MTPVKDHTGAVAKIVGVQLDVTATSEGLEDEAHGVPLLVHYDYRLQERVAKPALDDVLLGLKEDDEHDADSDHRLSCDSLLRHHHREQLDLGTTVERMEQCFVISDPNLPDCPIIYCSDPFLELTGYYREEVLGHNWSGGLEGQREGAACLLELEPALEPAFGACCSRRGAAARPASARL